MEREFLDEFGLELTSGDVNIGNTYPIFGMITKVVDSESGEVEAEINYNLKVRMLIPDTKRREVIKQRAFESGIFVCKITSKDPELTADCEAVIFGRSQSFHA